MKFNLIIGNPPYNTPRNPVNNCSQDLYYKFGIMAIKLSLEYTCMVIPAKWMAKYGKRMVKFREYIAKNAILIQSIDDFLAFGLKLHGGCCYYVTNAHRGNDITVWDGEPIILNNILKKFGIMIKLSPIEQSIFNKVMPKDFTENNLDRYMSAYFFGIRTNYKNYDTGSILCKTSKHKGNYRYVDIVKNEHILPKWKFCMPKSFGTKKDFKILHDKFISIESPDVALSESFIGFWCDTELEANNLKSFFVCKLIKFLISLRKNTHHISADTFKFLPKFDKNIDYNDDFFRIEFDLTDDEVNFLEDFYEI